MIHSELVNMTSRPTEADRLKEKAYRDSCVREHIRVGIPYQIRTLRQQKGWTQKELGDRLGKPQNVVSRLEDPSYGKLSLQSLLDLASAFDVALLVKFVSFGRFLGEFKSVSPQALAVQSFSEDVSLSEHSLCGFVVNANAGAVLAPCASVGAAAIFSAEAYRGLAGDWYTIPADVHEQYVRVPATAGMEFDMKLITLRGAA
ncbi:MAG: helix-turn-helix domain-containing protein [Terriglobia bacterium]